jgi:uracil-DNA glycosylase
MLTFELAKIYLRFYKRGTGRNLFALSKFKGSKWWMTFYKTVYLFSDKKEWDTYRFVDAQFSDKVVYPSQLATNQAWENYLEYRKRMVFMNTNTMNPNSLLNLYAKVNTCTKCKLCKNRMADYSFRGNELAKIMLIGEAPGSTEQETGRFFVGRSGKLLDKCLLACKLDPANDVYITNVVKDRPIDKLTGKDRPPFFDEVSACAPYLKEEIEIIKPILIVTLGKTAGDWFSDYGEYEINKYYPEKKWLPLYHPAYLGRIKEEVPKFLRALADTLKEVRGENKINA